METREIRLLESIEGALWKLAQQTELIAESLAEANERENARVETVRTTATP
jgi:hypothetical protein